GIYVQQLVCRLHHELDVAAFERAWQQVIARHEVFRTSFRWEGLDYPVQEVHRHVDVSLNVVDRASLSPAEQAAELDRFLDDDRRRGFSFTEAPLVRLTLFRFGADEYCLVWTSHHSLMDGRSRLRVLREVFAIYEGRDRNGFALPPARPFSDYLEWLAQRDLDAAECYWRELLRGFNAPNSLVIERRASRSSEQDAWGEESFSLTPNETAALLKRAEQHDLTLNTLVEGCWAIILSRYSDAGDVVFGTARVCRWADPAGEDAAAGLFINTVPLRVVIEPDLPVLSLLQELRQQSLAHREHVHTPLAKIQEWSALPPGQQLFDTIVVFEKYQLDAALKSLGGEWQRREFKLLERTNYPLAVSAYADYDAPSLLLKLTYDRSRFDEVAIKDMAARFRRLLESIGANPRQSISELPWLSEAERQQILVEWNATTQDYPRDKTIPELFGLQARQTPDAIALIAGDEHVTFATLNQRANQLARYLQRHGVGPEQRVAICMKRSVEFVVGLLGILKAGAAYVPIDETCPAQRLAFMVEDSGARILLTQTELARSIANESVDDLPTQITADNAAHVIYTSGSTGIPKGVLSSHRASLNRFFWMWRTYPFAADEVCCQKTSPGFVDSIWEIFGPLLRGIPQVIVADEIVKDPPLFLKTLADHRVTRLVLVPSLLAAILDANQDLEAVSQSLRYCVCSGETLSPELATTFRERLPHTRLINLYGSTEVAADVTCHEVQATEGSDRVPIGRPISNCRIYILDKHSKLAPAGLAGELYVAGDGLAREYLHRPEFTAERFIPDPFSAAPGARLFRTGDLARYLPDGSIDYLGRRDLQVKVRGFRVEIGEIEAVLVNHENVRDAVVVARENSFGEKELIAFLVPDGESPTKAALRAFVRERLPDYMTPADFVLLEQLPLTASGKADRRALSTIAAETVTASDAARAYVAPSNPIEKTLAGIWSAVLEVPRVGVDDDFVALGGSSLKAMRILSRVRSAFQVDLSLRTLFDSGSVAALALQVEEALISKLESLTEHEAQHLLASFTAAS
ncbi:MAG TPA: amino acid adenylation domain-containing protein, partial [Pyrinomonadaceae bacterium]